VYEKGPRARLEYNQSPKATRLSLAQSRDTLLNHATSKVGGNQSSLGVPDRFVEPHVTNTGLPCKAQECLVLEYPHPCSP
jgi:hypothetical protein